MLRTPDNGESHEDHETGFDAISRLSARFARHGERYANNFSIHPSNGETRESCEARFRGYYPDCEVRFSYDNVVTDTDEGCVALNGREAARKLGYDKDSIMGAIFLRPK